MKGIILRALRGVVATAVSTWLAAWQQNPKYTWLIPVILAVGKAIRTKFPKLEFLPF